jgi:hypothetical protein
MPIFEAPYCYPAVLLLPRSIKSGGRHPAARCTEQMIAWPASRRGGRAHAFWVISLLAGFDLLQLIFAIRPKFELANGISVLIGK